MNSLMDVKYARTCFGIIIFVAPDRIDLSLCSVVGGKTEIYFTGILEFLNFMFYSYPLACCIFSGFLYFVLG
jgi:hypothetical protein